MARSRTGSSPSTSWSTCTRSGLRGATASALPKAGCAGGGAVWRRSLGRPDARGALARRGRACRGGSARRPRARRGGVAEQVRGRRRAGAPARRGRARRGRVAEQVRGGRQAGGSARCRRARRGRPAERGGPGAGGGVSLRPRPPAHRGRAGGPHRRTRRRGPARGERQRGRGRDGVRAPGLLELPRPDRGGGSVHLPRRRRTSPRAPTTGRSGTGRSRRASGTTSAASCPTTGRASSPTTKPTR